MMFYQGRYMWTDRKQPSPPQPHETPGARCHLYKRYFSKKKMKTSRVNVQFNCNALCIFRVMLRITQKSRFCLMFLKRPPTIAAKWMTCVGRCFWKSALVSSMLLNNILIHIYIYICHPSPTHTSPQPAPNIDLSWDISELHNLTETWK